MVSNPSRAVVILLSLFAAFAFQSVIGLADVTGFFETHLLIIPQSQDTEISLMDFDVQNRLDATVVISGLSSTFHTHFGIAGVEDVILTTHVTIGALSAEAQLWFARFAFGAIDPFYDALHFVKKTVLFQLPLGGVTFANVAIFEDTDAFISQTPAYAFGDVFALQGSTPSGVELTAQVGICAERIPSVIKKHFSDAGFSLFDIDPVSDDDDDSFFFQVNPDCATEPKPDILFDFERLTITGVPVAPGITGLSILDCDKITACELTTVFDIATDMPFELQTEIFFEDLLSLSFSGAAIIFESGPGELRFFIGPDGTIQFIEVFVDATINPETHPAEFFTVIEAIPGVGFTSAVIGLEIERAGLVFGTTAVFAGSPAEFVAIIFDLEVDNGLTELDFSAVFTTDGFLLGDVFFTINF